MIRNCENEENEQKINNIWNACTVAFKRQNMSPMSQGIAHLRSQCIVCWVSFAFGDFVSQLEWKIVLNRLHSCEMWDTNQWHRWDAFKDTSWTNVGTEAYSDPFLDQIFPKILVLIFLLPSLLGLGVAKPITSNLMFNLKSSIGINISLYGSNTPTRHQRQNTEISYHIDPLRRTKLSPICFQTFLGLRPPLGGSKSSQKPRRPNRGKHYIPIRPPFGW